MSHTHFSLLLSTSSVDSRYTFLLLNISWNELKLSPTNPSVAFIHLVWWLSAYFYTFKYISVWVKDVSYTRLCCLYPPGLVILGIFLYLQIYLYELKMSHTHFSLLLSTSSVDSRYTFLLLNISWNELKLSHTNPSVAFIHLVWWFTAYFVYH